MRVLQVVPSFWPATRYGGPIVSVRQLCRSVQSLGVDVDVATTDIDGDASLDVPTDRWMELDGFRIRYFPRIGRNSYCLSPDMWRFLREQAQRYDLLHITGTFSFPSLAGGRAARRARTPYVVSPRGTLQACALRQKRWKKLPYWYAIERSQLAGAALLHATAEQEAEAVRTIFPHQRIAVVPNSIDPVVVPEVERRTRQVVFLGRIHPIKGLDILVDALTLVAECWPDLETIVAGPDDTGEWARVRARLERASPRPRVRYVGAIHGAAKYRLLAESTVLVLPSRSENFGLVVAEALACGTPVIVSRNAPWRCIEEEGAGYWVENRAEEIARSLGALLADVRLRERMGSAGRRIAERFTTSAVGGAMVRHYREILEASRPKPG